jgi:hypothetical protein
MVRTRPRHEEDFAVEEFVFFLAGALEGEIFLDGHGHGWQQHVCWRTADMLYSRSHHSMYHTIFVLA